MGYVFDLIKKLLGNNITSPYNSIPANDTLHTENFNETPIPMSIDWKSLVGAIVDDGYKLDHFDIHDLRIIAGNKILTILYDRRELGLHSFGIYDYCSTPDTEGHKLMAQIIRVNEDDAYHSLIIESSKNEFWINIADCTNRGAGLHQRAQEQMIEVFEPIILRFIKDNAIFNNVGICVSYGAEGTSVSALSLCQKLKELGLNIHLTLIESSWDMKMKDKFAPPSALLSELSCTYKVFQLPIEDNIFDFNKIEESSRKILFRAVSYLKTVISE